MRAKQATYLSNPIIPNDARRLALILGHGVDRTHRNETIIEVTIKRLIKSEPHQVTLPSENPETDQDHMMTENTSGHIQDLSLEPALDHQDEIHVEIDQCLDPDPDPARTASSNDQIDQDQVLIDQQVQLMETTTRTL